MRKFLALATLAALATLTVTAAAAAKGPATASLTGPGLGRALPVKGQGEGGAGTPLGSLVQFGGYFPQVFGQSPDPTTRTRPAGDLGPRYRIVYRVPGPSRDSTLVQDVYPYAKPAPATYMPPGQRFWGGQRTHGGWFLSGPELKATLVGVGLPKSPPASVSARLQSMTPAPVASRSRRISSVEIAKLASSPYSVVAFCSRCGASS